MLRFIRKKLSFLDVHTLEVLKKSASSTVVKVAGMIFGLLVSVFLGRTIGPQGLGIINLANQTASTVLIICLLGMRQVVIKEVAIGYSRLDWKHIGNVMYTSYLINGIVTIIIAILLILSTPFIAENIFHEPLLKTPLIIAFIALVPQVYSRLFSSALIGFKKIWQSNLADQTLSFAVIGITLLIMWLFNYKITIIRVALVYGFGRLSVMAALGLYWNQIYRKKEKPNFIGDKLIKMALPMLLVTSTAVIAANSSTIILGWLSDSKQIGLYTVASRIALLTSFFLLITNAAVSPKLASLYANGKIKEMEKMVQNITKGLGVLGLISLLVFIIFGKIILRLWGVEFLDAYWILIILSIGQVVNISTGAAGLLLVMCGFEKVQSRISLYVLFVSLPLNLLLIYKFGVIGAAIATAITVASENILKLFYAKKKIGILTFGLNN